jgi:ribosome recycling factor
MAAKTEAEIQNKLNEELKGVLAAFKRDLQKVRTGRASSGLLENLMVDYYGTRTQLSHLAQITSPEPRLLQIQVYDGGAVSAIEKAIQGANLGMNPSREGNSIRVLVPTLTQEARKEIVKVLNKSAEDMRVSARNHRRDANEELKKLEKDGVLGKDEAKRSMDKVQKQTDQTIEELDKLLAAKEQEVLEV